MLKQSPPNSDGDDPKDQLIPLDELLDMAEVTEDDVTAAVAWFNRHAPDSAKGALDEGESLKDEL